MDGWMDEMTDGLHTWKDGWNDGRTINMIFAETCSTWLNGLHEWMKGLADDDEDDFAEACATRFNSG